MLNSTTPLEFVLAQIAETTRRRDSAARLARHAKKPEHAATLYRRASALSDELVHLHRARIDLAQDKEYADFVGA